MASDGGEGFGRGGAGEPVFLLPRLLVIMSVVPMAITAIRPFLDPRLDMWLVYAFAFVPLREIEPSGWPGGEGAAAWSLLTHALLHDGWAHVLLNVAMIAAIGRAVLARLGSARFLALSAFATVGGALGHLAVEWASDAPMMGASGLASGLLGALLRFVFQPAWMPTAGIVESLSNPRVRGVVAALVIANLVLVFGGASLIGAEGGVAWGAHLGGFLAGFLGFPLFERRRRRSVDVA